MKSRSKEEVIADNEKLHAVEGMQFQFWINPDFPASATCFDSDNPLFSVKTEILFQGVLCEPNVPVMMALETAYITGQASGEARGRYAKELELQRALGI